MIDLVSIAIHAELARMNATMERVATLMGVKPPDSDRAAAKLLDIAKNNPRRFTSARWLEIYTQRATRHANKASVNMTARDFTRYLDESHVGWALMKAHNTMRREEMMKVGVIRRLMNWWCPPPKRHPSKPIPLAPSLKAAPPPPTTYETVLGLLPKLNFDEAEELTRQLQLAQTLRTRAEGRKHFPDEYGDGDDGTTPNKES